MAILPQCAVYMFQNMISGGVYVGQTIRTINERRGVHISMLRRGVHDNLHLQSAWNKYGEQAFEFCILETYATIEETNEAEIFYIQYFRSIGVRLYNIRDGGAKGRMSVESRAKMSIAKRGRKQSAAHTAKIKEARARTGYTHSAETREKMSVINSNRSASTRAKMSASARGRVASAETKERLRIAHLGWKDSPETRAKKSVSSRAGKLAFHKKNYVFMSPDGELVRAQNISVLAQEYGLQISKVSNLVHGTRKTHKGWSFVEIEE